jgi:drug/metabolite transporter (DMT)-like permease
MGLDGKGGMSAVMMVIGAACLWGIVGLFTRPLSAAGLSSMQITEVRCIVTSVAMLAIVLLYDRSLMRIDAKDIWMFIGTGVLSIVLFNTMYFQAIEMLSLSMAAVLLYTAPCFVMLMSLLVFHERMTSRKILALVMSFCGCVCTAGIVGGGGDMLGIAIGLGSGFCYALYTIFGKFALAKYHPFTVTLYTFVIAGLCLAPICGLGGIADVAMEGDNLFYMVGLGILITTIPYFLYTFGLKGMDPGKASVIAFTEPMVATVAGLVFYGESLTVMSAAGILLILVSIILLAPAPSGVSTDNS